MTAKEAWCALAYGCCVISAHCIYRICQTTNQLQFWLVKHNTWEHTDNIDSGPYSIVPDPSQPEAKVSEYEKDREALIKSMQTYNLPGANERTVIEFFEKHFVRKEP